MAEENTNQDPQLLQRRRQSRERLQRWAWLLDDAVRIPVINVRVGLDALVGLIPVVGDFAGVALSSVLFAEAVRLRAPRHVLTRMGRNIVTDFVVGLIPIAGDFFDVAWRANRRNMAVLNAWLDENEKAQARRRWPAALLGLGFLVAAGLICYALWHLLFS